MVQIHVTLQGEEDQFLYECESTKEINEIAKDVIEIHNLRSHIHHLSLALQQPLQPQTQTQGCHPNAAIPLMRALSEAKAYASKDQALNNRLLSPHVLRDHIQTIEREALVNQLMGFSDSNQLQKLFSDLPDMELLQEDTTQLWWAGKELVRSKRLCDYVGRNEKTKILLRLEKMSLDPACHSGQD